MFIGILYFIGVILGIKAVIDILNLPIKPAGKIISIILVLFTSWVGLAIYYIFAKDHLVEWFR